MPVSCHLIPLCIHHFNKQQTKKGTSHLGGLFSNQCCRQNSLDNSGIKWLRRSVIVHHWGIILIVQTSECIQLFFRDFNSLFHNNPGNNLVASWSSQGTF